MWETPYIGFSILVLCTSWYQTILFGLLCAIFVLSVMCVACYLRLRMAAKAIRVLSEESVAERTRIAYALQDTLLQTIEGGKFFVDAVLDKSNDPDHMRLALEKLSSWLGQATQEGLAVLKALRTPTTELASKRHKKSQE